MVVVVILHARHSVVLGVVVIQKSDSLPHAPAPLPLLLDQDLPLGLGLPLLEVPQSLYEPGGLLLCGVLHFASAGMCVPGLERPTTG